MALGTEVNVDLEPGLINQQYRRPPGTVPVPTDPAGGAGVTPITSGGTGASTAPAGRANLGAAASGSNADITDLTGLTAPLDINGLQVLGNRKTGWGAPAGTLSRAAYTGTTAAALPIGAAYTQAEVVALRDAVVALSQTLAALLNDIHASTSGANDHKFIGT